MLNTYHTQGACSCYSQATVLPFQQNGYACYDCKQKLISDAMLYRNYGMIFPSVSYRKAVVQKNEPCIFCGFLFKHYGHFLLESLSRLWFAKEHPQIPIAFVARDGLILQFQEEIFKILNITNPYYTIDQPVLFEKLFVPEPGYIIQCHFSEFYNNFLSQVPPSPLCPGKTIYLSRRKFGGISCFNNEAELEEALQKKGIEIFYPEEHNIQEQLATISSAERILALEGSALHTLILLTHLESSILLIPRPMSYPNMNFQTIADRKHFTQCYIPARDLYTEILPVHDSHVRYSGTIDIDHLLSYLDGDDWREYARYSRWYSGHYGTVFTPAADQDERIHELEKENTELKSYIKALYAENKKLMQRIQNTRPR